MVLVCVAVLAFASTAYGAEHLEEEHRYKVILEHVPGEHTPGKRVYVCEICGYTYSEDISITGHKWGEWIVDVEPTEEMEGHRYRVCTKYPDSPHYQEEAVPKLKTQNKSSNYRGQNKTKSESTEDKNRKKSSNINDENKNKRDFVKKDMKLSLQSEENYRETQVEHAGEYNNQDLFSADIVKSSIKNAGGINSVDVFSAFAFSGIVWWYIVVLYPIYLANVWIKNKKKQIRERVS